MKQTEIFSNCLNVLKGQIKEERSNEIGIILFDETVDGKLYEFELKATEKSKAQEYGGLKKNIGVLTVTVG